MKIKSRQLAQLACFLFSAYYIEKHPDAARGHNLWASSTKFIVAIENKGAVPVGMTIVFKANGTLENPSLINVNTQKYFKINKTMRAGEEIRINTMIGEKKDSRYVKRVK